MDNIFTQSSFTNRATYLLARQVWKKNYADLSIQIRTTKLAFKAAQRAYSNNSGTLRDMNGLLYQMEILKGQARDQMAYLADAKLESARIREIRIATLKELYND